MTNEQLKYFVERIRILKQDLDSLREQLKQEPRKPREWWVNRYGPSIFGSTCFHESKADADASARTGRIECIHVREALEDGK